jgi:hypothetical protein
VFAEDWELSPFQQKRKDLVRRWAGNVDCLAAEKFASTLEKQCVAFVFAVLGMEPGVSCMLGKCSATELCPHPQCVASASCFFLGKSPPCLEEGASTNS